MIEHLLSRLFGRNFPTLCIGNETNSNFDVKTAKNKTSKKTNELKTLKLGAAILETILAIPILGAMIILFSFWLLLPVEIALGIIGLMMSKKAKTKKTGHILQIITGCIAWIPFIGWIMHLISAITLWLEWKKI